MKNIKFGKYEIEQFNLLKSTQPIVLKREIYAIATAICKLPTYEAESISELDNLEDIAKALDIPYEENGDSAVNYIYTADYIFIKRKFLLKNGQVATECCMCLLKYLVKVSSDYIGRICKVDNIEVRVDYPRLYSVCKNSDNLELYRKYFHDKYCNNLTVVGGDNFPCMVGVTGLITIEDSIKELLPNNKVKFICKNEFGAKVYDINPDTNKRIDLLNIRNILEYNTAQLI